MQVYLEGRLEHLGLYKSTLSSHNVKLLSDTFIRMYLCLQHLFIVPLFP